MTELKKFSSNTLGTNDLIISTMCFRRGVFEFRSAFSLQLTFLR